MMNLLSYTADTLPLYSTHLLPHRTKLPLSQSLKLSQFAITKTRLPLLSKPLSNLTRRRCPIQATASGSTSYDIDMIRNREGIYAPKQKKVVVLWDLDNKPPRGPPYQAAMELKRVAQRFGDVVEISAYANRHAFVHLPQWVLEERRERRKIDIFERKGILTPPEPYICSVCGRKCKTNFDLKKHFKQLHERERQKKLNRMKSLKGKKRQKYKERFISGNHKYNEAARSLITPKVGYGLASELRRAGVFVKTVKDKPQAADWAVKRQMQHSMSRGIDWLVLVSDDSDFQDMLRRAREANLGTVVVSDWDRALGRHADLWVPWNGVEKGEISEKDLVLRSKGSEFVDKDYELYSDAHSDGTTDSGSSLDSLVNELAATRSEFNLIKNASFSEEEDRVTVDLNYHDDDDDDGDLWNSDDEDSEEEDWYI